MRRGVLLTWLWVLAGCPPPSGSDGGTDAGRALTPVELCDALAAARCALENRCYPAFASLSGAACEALEQGRCLAEYEALRGSFDEGRTAVDGAKVASCVARMETSACPPSFPPDYPADVARPFSDCQLTSGLLTGTVASGQLCVNPVDCAPGTVCVKANGVCRGTCSTSPAEGEGCAFGCARGLFCGLDGGCQRPQALDAPCTASRECEAELLCVAGTCRPRHKLNEPCLWDPDRLSSCEPGLACDVVPWVAGATGTCVRPRPSGESCRFHWACQPGLVCADLGWAAFPQAAPTEGLCRVPDGVDFNCPRTQYAAFVGDQCAPGLACTPDTGKCRPMPGMSDACTPSVQNCSGYGLYCKPSGSGDTGLCTGPGAVGDTCAFRIDAATVVTIPCSGGFCDGEATQTCRSPTQPLGALCTQDGECQSGRCAVQQDRTLRCAEAC